MEEENGEVKREENGDTVWEAAMVMINCRHGFTGLNSAG